MLQQQVRELRAETFRLSGENQKERHRREDCEARVAELEAENDQLKRHGNASALVRREALLEAVDYYRRLVDEKCSPGRQDDATRR